jgi:3'5'-cyclic nucleotide phosphodiesterase
MATDIMDKDLMQLRNARWDKAFSIPSELSTKESSKDAADRKATIVIEHMVQASDVSHKMQHWHVYRRWNERLFSEMYKAYIDGRSDTDPSATWYQRELGFFRFYIIPLAKKLKDCGVFGVSSNEYLHYAVKNRREWGERGESVVAEMIAKMKAEKGKGS